MVFKKVELRRKACVLFFNYEIWLIRVSGSKMDLYSKSEISGPTSGILLAISDLIFRSCSRTMECEFRANLMHTLHIIMHSFHLPLEIFYRTIYIRSTSYHFASTALMKRLFLLTGAVILTARADKTDIFKQVVQQADNERSLLKSTGQNFRSIAAKLRPIFRD